MLAMRLCRRYALLGTKAWYCAIPLGTMVLCRRYALISTEVGLWRYRPRGVRRTGKRACPRTLQSPTAFL
eukprot:2624358-Rhodomonas_salina.1